MERGKSEKRAREQEQKAEVDGGEEEEEVGDGKRLNKVGGEEGKYYIRNFH